MLGVQLQPVELICRNRHENQWWEGFWHTVSLLMHIHWLFLVCWGRYVHIQKITFPLLGLFDISTPNIFTCSESEIAGVFLIIWVRLNKSWIHSLAEIMWKLKPRVKTRFNQWMSGLWIQITLEANTDLVQIREIYCRYHLLSKFYDLWPLLWFMTLLCLWPKVILMDLWPEGIMVYDRFYGQKGSVWCWFWVNNSIRSL